MGRNIKDRVMNLKLPNEVGGRKNWIMKVHGSNDVAGILH
jgi:hypothetical protein